ncbi:hypothetical protein LITTLEDOG_9 [Serratia phage vB_SmaS_LittleDog]|uniref:Uncharacterized protein n=1 Tax=Serratia phage vB_SmaS_Bigdog TaxID=2777364 RepID=A0A7T3TL51_9CAUD|nr:hypothetical protein QJS28_gp09 [Serratia phage vB_SmaS_Bigdog]QPX75410.1 hypothetical protein [Serratia phage vB_SmaS_Opt-148]UGO51751.1 hypothetical protein SWAIN_9 [Serratia phage vB_SmaS_Swain]UGO51815.1 hypothetical protein CARROT_9 [Serratia phage vB_SmaS_Carrot]UGO53034.1 hypothetical protein LITTLEDOG_9 [Serratia phage vB_SmaS_LittleDog]QPX75114.1 hypothetical protein BIGDOG_9 [Serratia phage vB_SmaS_Bigdog]
MENKTLNENPKKHIISKANKMTGVKFIDDIAREVLTLRDTVESEFLSEETYKAISAIIDINEIKYSNALENWLVESAKREDYSCVCSEIASSIRMIGLKDAHLDALRLLAGGSPRLAKDKLEAMRGDSLLDEKGIDYGL